MRLQTLTTISSHPPAAQPIPMMSRLYSPLATSAHSHPPIAPAKSNFRWLMTPPKSPLLALLPQRTINPLPSTALPTMKAKIRVTNLKCLSSTTLPVLSTPAPIQSYPPCQITSSPTQPQAVVPHPRQIVLRHRTSLRRPPPRNLNLTERSRDDLFSFLPLRLFLVSLYSPSVLQRYLIFEPFSDLCCLA